MNDVLEFSIDTSSFEYQRCLQKLEDNKKIILFQKLDDIKNDPWKEAIPLKGSLSNKHKVKFDNGNFRLIIHVNFSKKIIKTCYLIPRRRKKAYEEIW